MHFVLFIWLYHWNEIQGYDIKRKYFKVSLYNIFGLLEDFTLDRYLNIFILFQTLVLKYMFVVLTYWS